MANYAELHLLQGIQQRQPRAVTIILVLSRGAVTQLSYSYMPTLAQALWCVLGSKLKLGLIVLSCMCCRAFSNSMILYLQPSLVSNAAAEKTARSFVAGALAARNLS